MNGPGGITYEFIVKEFIPYEKRIKKDLIFNSIITLGIVSIGFFITHYNVAVVLVGFIFFAVQYYKSARWDRFYIATILIKDQDVCIDYWDKNEKKIAQGEKDNFRFKKKFAWNRTRTPYLGIYYKDTLLIKQFEQDKNWNEKKIDEIILLFK